MNIFDRLFQKNLLLKIILFVIAIVFIALSFFTHPILDDFHFAEKALNLGFIKAQTSWYKDFSPRYFATAILSLYIISSNFFGIFFESYKIISLLLFTLFFISLYTFIKTFVSDRLSNKEILWGVFLFFIIYITRMPSNIEGFYWLASAVTYQGGNILSLFLISLLLNSHKFEFPTTVHITGGCLIVLAAVGSNETVMLIILAILVIGTFITVYMKHPASLLWKIVLITGIIGAVIVVIAPGNAVRASEAADKHLFLQSLLNSIIWTSRYLFTWTLDVGLLSASLLFFPIAVSLNNHSDFYRFHKKHLFLFLIVWLSLIILTFFPCFWALGRMGGLRITNTAYLIFLIGWFLSIFFFVNVFIKDTKSDVVIHKYVLVAAEIILIIGLLGRGNFRPALQDLIFHAPSYNRQLNERYSIIKQSLEQKITHIEVPALKGPLPTTICRVQWWAEDDNITTNPNDWRNQSFAGFFNAESIIAVFPEKKEKNSSGGGAK